MRGGGRGAGTGVGTARGGAGGKHGGTTSYSGSIGQKAQLASAYAELGKELLSTQLKVIGNYTLGRVIGEGSFGKVRLGVHRLTGTRVAIKHIPKSASPPLLTREIHHHRRLHHPCVVQLYEIIATENAIWLVTELCAGGELFDYLVEKGRLAEPEARRIFGQLCLGMGYVHREGVVHRDLKLENVLLDQRCNAKVADFGFGREYEQRKLMETYCGTTGYAAPEMLGGRKYSGEEVDIWSMGIILYTLLAGSLPFDDDDEEVMKEAILKGEYVLPDFLSKEARDLISQILQLNPKDRPSIEKILSHPWFSVPASLHEFDAFSHSPGLVPDTIAEEDSPLPSSSAGASSPLADPFGSSAAAPATALPRSSSSSPEPAAGPVSVPSESARAAGLGILSESEISERSSTGAASDLSMQGSSSRSGASSPVTSEDAQDSGLAAAAGETPTPTTAVPPGEDAKLGLAHPNASESTIRKPDEASATTPAGKGKRRQAPPALPTHEEGEPDDAPPPVTPAGFQFPRAPSSNPPSLGPAAGSRTGSLKRRSVPNSPAALFNPSSSSSPAVGSSSSRTPSRTKRRSIGSTISERMLPLADDSATASGAASAGAGAGTGVGVGGVVEAPPFDWAAALRSTPHGPPLSTSADEAFLTALGALGLDVGQMGHSVKTHACDASSALWWLLKRKAEAKDGLERLIPGATPAALPPPTKKDVEAKSAKAKVGEEASSRSGQKHPTEDKLVVPAQASSGKASEGAESLSSSGYFTAWGESSEPGPTVPAGEGPLGTPPSSSTAAFAFAKDLDATPTASPTPNAGATPPPASTPKSADRRRSQSVSMLQRATSALAAKKSDDGGKLAKGKSRGDPALEAGAIPADEKKDGGAVAKNLDEGNRSGSNLASLFSRRAVSDQRGPLGPPRDRDREAGISPERPSMSLPSSPVKTHHASSVDAANAAARRGSDPAPDLGGDRRPVIPSSATYETLSTLAGGGGGGDGDERDSTTSPRQHGKAPSRGARVNLFSTFRLWFMEDRRKRKRKVTGAGAGGAAAGGAGAYAQALNRTGSAQSSVGRSRQGSMSRQTSSPGSYRLTPADVPSSSSVARQASASSRRSSIHSSGGRAGSLDLGLAVPARSRRRSDASFGSHVDAGGSKTPTSDREGSVRSATHRRSFDQTRRGGGGGHGHMRQPSTGSSHSRRSAASHLSPTQPYRRTPTGTTVRRISTTTTTISAAGDGVKEARPGLHPRSHSQASSARVSVSSDDDEEPDFGGHDVDETIVEEADGEEADADADASTSAAASHTTRSKPRTPHHHHHHHTTTTTTTVFTAHKTLNVFGTPASSAAFLRSNRASTATDEVAAAAASARPELRDIFARGGGGGGGGGASASTTSAGPGKGVGDDGDWVDEDDDPLVFGRYSGGLGQQSMSFGGGGGGGGVRAASVAGTGANARPSGFDAVVVMMPHTPPVSTKAVIDPPSGPPQGSGASTGLLGEGRYAAVSTGQRPAQRTRPSAFKGSAIVEEEEEEEEGKEVEGDDDE